MGSNGGKMLNTEGQVGREKLGPRESTPLTERNMEMGLPRANKEVGWMSRVGKVTDGWPGPAGPDLAASSGTGSVSGTTWPDRMSNRMMEPRL